MYVYNLFEKIFIILFYINWLNSNKKITDKNSIKYRKKRNFNFLMDEKKNIQIFIDF